MSRISVPVLAMLTMIPLQAAPNLNGAWKLDLSRSNYGPMPAPVVFTKKITQQGEYDVKQVFAKQ